MEVSAENNNPRTACFEILLELSSLELLVYTTHYAGDAKAGSPGKGWVIVWLISGLSALTTQSVESQANTLKSVWSSHRGAIADNKDSVEPVVATIDIVRAEIKPVLSALEELVISSFSAYIPVSPAYPLPD